MRPAIGKPAHQLDRVVDVDSPREDGLVLAGPHVRDRGADERKFMARSLERCEVGVAQVEEEALRCGAARRNLDGNAGLTAVQLNAGTDEAVASDDKAGTVCSFLEISFGHCRIY